MKALLSTFHGASISGMCMIVKILFVHPFQTNYVAFYPFPNKIFQLLLINSSSTKYAHLLYLMFVNLALIRNVFTDVTAATTRNRNSRRCVCFDTEYCSLRCFHRCSFLSKNNVETMREREDNTASE